MMMKDSGKKTGGEGIAGFVSRERGTGGSRRRRRQRLGAWIFRVCVLAREGLGWCVCAARAGARGISHARLRVRLAAKALVLLLLLLVVVLLVLVVLLVVLVRVRRRRRRLGLGLRRVGLERQPLLLLLLLVPRALVVELGERGALHVVLEVAVFLFCLFVWGGGECVRGWRRRAAQVAAAAARMCVRPHGRHLSESD